MINGTLSGMEVSYEVAFIHIVAFCINTLVHTNEDYDEIHFRVFMPLKMMLKHSEVNRYYALLLLGNNNGHLYKYCASILF